MDQRDQLERDQERPPTKATDPDTAAGNNEPTVGIGPRQAPVDDLIGKVLGDYLLLEEIGSGGGGRVYKAKHQRMDRVVALKIFSQAVVGDGTQLKRFHREVRAAARLLHRNIVTAFDAGEHDSIHFLVMEYIDGPSLGQLVRRQGRLSIELATQYLIQAAEGLVYAHSEGVVHRDIKPDNIIVDKSGNVKLLDMGLARLNTMAWQESQAPADSAELTAHGIVVGTIGYISPEQISDASNVDERSDIYSLGCTYYYLLTGEAPYQGSILSVFQAHAKSPIPCVTDARRDASYHLDALLQQMMAKEPDQRPASAQELIGLLESFARPIVDEATGTPGTDRLRREVLGHFKSDEGVSIRCVMGIDIGARSAHVSSIADDGVPTAIADTAGAIATPSALFFQGGGFLLGRAAIRKAAGGFSNFADRLTRQLGTTAACRKVGDQQVPHPALFAVVVKTLQAAAERKVGPMENAAYTIPGCFGEARRRAYRDAYRIALGGWLEPVNAATAVAIQFCFLHGWLNPRRKSPAKNLLVFRFGSGSFDATVFHIQERKLSAVAMLGDPELGESAWDDRIVDRVIQQIRAVQGSNAFNEPGDVFLLKQQIETATHQLFQGCESFPLSIPLRKGRVRFVLSDDGVQKEGARLLAQTEQLTNEALQLANMGWQDLDHVLLAGSATSIPFVKEEVKRWSGNQEICSVAGPDVASGGAALFAQSFHSEHRSTLDFQVHDVASHHYGIRSSDPTSGSPATTIVIPKNSALPVVASATVKKTDPRQSAVTFEVIECADSDALQTTVLGTCTIGNLPPGLRAGAPIEFELSLDARGVVAIYVRLLATGRRDSPKYEPSIQISESQLHQWQDWLKGLHEL